MKTWENSLFDFKCFLICVDVILFIIKSLAQIAIFKLTFVRAKGQPRPISYLSVSVISVYSQRPHDNNAPVSYCFASSFCAMRCHCYSLLTGCKAYYWFSHATCSQRSQSSAYIPKFLPLYSNLGMCMPLSIFNCLGRVVLTGSCSVGSLSQILL